MKENSGINPQILSASGRSEFHPVDPEDKAKNFGMLGAAFGLGFIIGPSIGGVFGAMDVRLPFFIAAGLTLANFLFGYFVLPESLAPENRRSVILRKMIPGVSLAHLGRYKGLGLLVIAFFFAHNCPKSTHTQLITPSAHSNQSMHI